MPIRLSLFVCHFLLAALLLLGSSASAASFIITTTITLTNVPAISNSIVLNSDTRQWNTNSSSTRIFATNSIHQSTTNLYNHLVTYPFTGPYALSYTATNQIKLVAPGGTNVLVTFGGSWATVAYVTNVTATTYPLLVPYTYTTNLPVQTNLWSLVIDALALSTNKFPTNIFALQNFLSLRGGTNWGGTFQNPLLTNATVFATNGRLVNVSSDGMVATNFSSLGAGELSIQVGGDAHADGTYAIALGNESTATGGFDISIGGGAAASGGHSTAVGSPSEAGGVYSISLGAGSTALSPYSIGIGYDVGTGTTHTNSVSLGTGTQTTKKNQLRFGTSDFETSIPGTLSVESTAAFSNTVRIADIRATTGAITNITLANPYQFNTTLDTTTTNRGAWTETQTNITTLAAGSNNVTIFATVNFFAVSGTTSPDLAGLSSGWANRRVTLRNDCAGQLTIAHLSGFTGTAADRFSTPGGLPFPVPSGGYVGLRHNGTYWTVESSTYVSASITNNFFTDNVGVGVAGITNVLLGTNGDVYISGAISSTNLTARLNAQTNFAGTTNGVVAGMTNVGTFTTDASLTSGMDIRTNQFSGTTFWFGTNQTIVCSSNIYITAVGNTPTSTHRGGQLIIVASGGNVTLTNFAGFKMADRAVTRVITNGNSFILYGECQTGIYTNGAGVQF